MVFALGAREGFFDVVEAPDQAWSEVESFRFERLARLRLLEGVEPGAERVVHDLLERRLPFALRALEAHCDVVVKRQGGPHIMMLTR